MHKVPCGERSDFESIFDCYFIQGYSEGAKDRLAAQSSVQGQVWGREEEIEIIKKEVLNFLENTSSCIILRAGLEWIQCNFIYMDWRLFLTSFYDSSPIEFLHLNFWFETYICVDKLTHAMTCSTCCWTNSMLYGDLYQLALSKKFLYTIWRISTGQRLFPKSSLNMIMCRGVVWGKTFMDRPCCLVSVLASISLHCIIYWNRNHRAALNVY